MFLNVWLMPANLLAFPEDYSQFVATSSHQSTAGNSTTHPISLWSGSAAQYLLSDESDADRFR